MFPTLKSFLSIRANRLFLLTFVLLALSTPLWAHVGTGLHKQSSGETILLYLKLGFLHILPLGFDHILFVLSLFLLSPRLKPILFQSLTFTVAHSVTLGLAIYGVISPPGAVIEPVIALSIMFVALQNIRTKKLKPARIAVVFLFGLVHGMGFAGALKDLGLPHDSFLTALVMFNLGVELGQVTVILLAFFLIGKWFGHKPYYHRYIVVPLSIIISLVAAFWTVQRIFFVK